MIKRTILLASLFAALGGTVAHAQGMAINTAGAAADNSAMLDVSSTSKGMLVPRMTLANRGNIGSPATGLLIYQTDNTPGFYVYNGTAWTAVTQAASGGSTSYTNITSGTSLAAAAGGHYLISKDNVAITVPANPNVGDQIKFVLSAETYNNITINFGPYTAVYSGVSQGSFNANTNISMSVDLAATYLALFFTGSRWMISFTL